jgi:integrase
MRTPNRTFIQQEIEAAVPDPKGKTRRLYRIAKADFLLQVTPQGVKSWCYRYTLRGRTRVMGLGPVRKTSFEEAAKHARKIRVLLDEGIDPLAVRDRQQQEKHQAHADKKTFRDCATEFIAAHRAGWKSAKHAAQWAATLKTYAYPVLGDIPVAAVDVGLVKKVIDPIWRSKNETAERVRNRLEKVLGWATVHGYRTGENPARWVGHLSEVFPKRAAVRKIKHHPALPYNDLPEFMHMLTRTPSVGAILLRFLVLTVTRTSEARAAKWTEIDFEQELWLIPAERMKASRPHRIPLNEPAMRILQQMKALNDAHPEPSEYVFNGRPYGRAPSQMIMLELLKRIERTDIVPHGFRSTFRDFVAERTTFPREVAEAALAHAVENKVEAAYQRGDYLDKRRVLMNAWGIYCETGVIPT